MNDQKPQTAAPVHHFVGRLLFFAYMLIPASIAWTAHYMDVLATGLAVGSALRKARKTRDVEPLNRLAARMRGVPWETYWLYTIGAEKRQIERNLTRYPPNADDHRPAGENQ